MLRPPSNRPVRRPWRASCCRTPLTVPLAPGTYTLATLNSAPIRLMRETVERGAGR